MVLGGGGDCGWRLPDRRVAAGWGLGLLCLGLWAVAAWREQLLSSDVPSPPAPLRPRDVPFPAVTVCPAERVRPGPERAKFWPRKQIAKEYLCPEYYGTENHLYDRSMLEKEVPTLEEVVKDCRWEGEPLNCSQVFQEIFTEEGVCFAFNMLHPKNLVKNDTLYVSDLQYWDAEGGYPSGMEVDVPRRMGSGGSLGLRLELASTRASTWEEDPCRTAATGLKVFLHNPSDYPSTRYGHIAATFFEEREVLVEPRLRVEMEKREYWLRGCKRANQGHLENYLTYSRTKCRRDCYRSIAIDKCICIPFWLSEPNPPQGQRICGPYDRQCLKKISGHKEEENHSCECEPECWSLTYNIVASIGVSFEPSNETGNPYSVITIKPQDIVDVVPQSYIPVIIEEYGSAGTVFLVSGLCLILYLGLMVVVSNQERQSRITTSYGRELRPTVVTKRTNDVDPPLLVDNE